MDRFGTVGRPIICVPGLGDLRSSYRSLVPLLVGSGHTLYVMDLRGHGDSDVGFDSYSAADIGEDILALIEQEDLHDVIVVGNSIGGGASCFAASSSDRIVGQVLLNPFVRDMPADRFLRPLSHLLFMRPWGVWVWGQYRSTLFKTAPADLEENHRAVLDNLRKKQRLEAAMQMIRASKAPVAERLGTLTIPSLVVMGAEDPDYGDPVAEGELLKRLLGGDVESVVLDGVGHYPQVENAEETAAHIVSFVERVHGA
ncbi:MAG: alpha/beta hydrolase [Myxococcota bacterium]